MTLSYSIAVFDVAYFGCGFKTSYTPRSFGEVISHLIEPVAIRQIPISLTSRAVPSQKQPGVRFSVATLSTQNNQPRFVAQRRRHFKFSCYRARRSGHWRLLIISVLMCTVFTLLFIPSVVVNLLEHSECFDPRIHMGCSIMTWFNSCSNPIIYCLLYPRFQREYKRLLKCQFRRSFSSLSDGCGTNSSSRRKSPRFSSFSSVSRRSNVTQSLPTSIIPDTDLSSNNLLNTQFK